MEATRAEEMPSTNNSTAALMARARRRSSTGHNTADAAAAAVAAMAMTQDGGKSVKYEYDFVSFHLRDMSSILMAADLKFFALLLA